MAATHAHALGAEPAAAPAGGKALVNHAARALRVFLQAVRDRI
jgi:hypothetical protein